MNHLEITPPTDLSSQLQKKWKAFEAELFDEPHIAQSVTTELKDFFLAKRVNCISSGEILSPCTRIYALSEQLSRNGTAEPIRQLWTSVLNEAARDPLPIHRKKYPPTNLKFDLSRALMNGADPDQLEIKLLNPNDPDEVGEVVNAMLRVDQMVQGTSYSHKVLRILLSAPKTLCLYARALDKRVVGYLYGLHLEIPRMGQDTTRVFFVMNAAREPEYGSKRLHELFHETMYPLITQGFMKSEFLTWYQEINHPANRRLWEGVRGRYFGCHTEPVEGTLSVKPTVMAHMAVFRTRHPNYPSVDEIQTAVVDYCKNEGGFLRFAWEFFKMRLHNNLNSVLHAWSERD